jgi:hypothetical protein
VARNIIYKCNNKMGKQIKRVLNVRRMMMQMFNNKSSREIGWAAVRRRRHSSNMLLPQEVQGLFVLFFEQERPKRPGSIY